jgi:hypothetical protein
MRSCELEIASPSARNDSIEKCHCELLHSAVALLTGKETIVGVIARSGFCDEAIPNSLAGDCFGKKRLAMTQP